MSKNQPTTTTFVLLAEDTAELLSVYGAANAVNEVLRANGWHVKDLPPQMFYNYTTARIRAGKAPAMETVQIATGFRITAKGLDAWLVGYVTRKGFSIKPQDPEQAEFDAAEAV